MDLLQILLIPLATWRLYRIFATDTGPKQILRKLRVKIGVKYALNQDKSVDWEHWTTPDGSFAEYITCCWCASFWWGIVLTALAFWAPNWLFFFIVVPFNASAFRLFFENKIYSK